MNELADQTPGSLPLVCPYCGDQLAINLETVGPAYGQYEIPESIYCDASDCEATWEPNGDARNAPRWERWPILYRMPQRAVEREQRRAASR